MENIGCNCDGWKKLEWYVKSKIIDATLKSKEVRCPSCGEKLIKKPLDVRIELHLWNDSGCADSKFATPDEFKKIINGEKIYGN